MSNPVAFLQGTDATSFSAVVTRAATLTNVAGNLGIVVAHSGLPTDTFTILDTQGNTWVALTPAASTQTATQAWYCLSLKGGSNIVTITGLLTGSTTRGCLFAEWTVTAGTVAFDKQGSHGVTAGTTLTTPASGTLSSAAEIVIGYFTTGVAAQTFGNSIGTIEYTSAHTTVDSCVTDQYVSATTSVTQAVTCTTSSTSVSGIATFAFTASTHSVSGNAGVAGATVAYSGTSSGSVTADGSGNYTISGLVNGSYTITPSLAGYTFSPASQNKTVSGSNITGVNFTATATSGGGGANTPAGYGTGISASTEISSNPSGEIGSGKTAVFGTNRGTRIIG